MYGSWAGSSRICAGFWTVNVLRKFCRTWRWVMPQWLQHNGHWKVLVSCHTSKTWDFPWKGLVGFAGLELGELFLKILGFFHTKNNFRVVANKKVFAYFAWILARIWRNKNVFHFSFADYSHCDSILCPKCPTWRSTDWQSTIFFGLDLPWWEDPRSPARCPTKDPLWGAHAQGNHWYLGYHLGST